MTMGITNGNVFGMRIAQIALTPASVATNTTAEQTFTVPGLGAGDVVVVWKPTLQAGLGLIQARVSAANTLAITFGNFTASPIVPTAGEQYILWQGRPESGTPRQLV